MFENELALIKNTEILQIAKQIVDSIPEYFYRVPASTSGKHHPSYALGEGGLHRHTQATVRVAMDLFHMKEYSFSQDDKDLIITSLIGHDTRKQGEAENGYLFMHPRLASDFIAQLRVPDYNLRKAIYLFKISMNVACHMGQWNTSTREEGRLPKPVSKMQKFVHLCDYLASRKDIEIRLDLPLTGE